MNKCRILYKGEEISVEQLWDMVKENGVRAMLDPESSPNPKARKIIARYDTKASEDSVMEMLAKINITAAASDAASPAHARAKELLPRLDMLASSEIQEFLYPVGQLSDYSTQWDIKRNIDAGARMTGISASFGKTLAYVFGAEPATKIEIDGQVFDSSNREEWEAMLTKYRVRSVDALLDRYSNVKVLERSIPRFRPDLSIRINNSTLGSLSRNTIDTKNNTVLLHNGMEISVFELVDTIINLSIDNVKEQKLAFLGLTNSNANMFLSLLSYGVPIQEAVLIFNMPVIRELSENRFLSRDAIEEYAEEAVHKLSDLYVASPEQFRAALDTLFPDGSTASRIMQELSHSTASTAEAINKAFAREGTIVTDVLKSFMSKETEMTDVHRAMLDLLGTQLMRKLQRVGNQLFNYSQMFTLLRREPSSKWKIQSLLDTINPYAFGENAEPQYWKALAADTIGEIILGSEAYEQVREEARKKAIAEEETEERAEEIAEEAANKYFKSEMKRLTTPAALDLFVRNMEEQSRARMVNKLIRRSDTKNLDGTVDNIFVSNNPLRLPHVYSAWRTLHLLNRVIERSFTIHSPVLQQFVTEVFNDTDIRIYGKKYRRIEEIKNEFMRFIASNVQIQVRSGSSSAKSVIDMGDTPSTQYTLPNGKVLTGQAAWTQRFLDDLTNLLDLIPENLLLRNLEVSRGRNGVKSLMLLSDKLGAEIFNEELRSAFVNLLKSNKYMVRTADGYSLKAIPSTGVPEGGIAVSEMAKDMFKYAVLANGLYYKRTAISAVFPLAWNAAYSKQLSYKLAKFVSERNPARVAANLFAIKAPFLFQLLRNNVKQLRYIPGSPEVVRTIDVKGRNNKTYKRKVFRGKETVNGKTFSYDLKYAYKESQQEETEETKELFAPKFIARHGTAVYVKLKVNNPGYVYYRMLTDGNDMVQFGFDDEMTVKGLNIDELRAGDRIVVTPENASISNNRIVITSDNSEEYALGETVYYHDTSSLWPTKLRVATIDSIVEVKKDKEYKFKTTEIKQDVSITNDQEIAKKAIVVESLESRVPKTPEITEDVEEAMRKASKKPYAAVVTTNAQEERTGPKVIILDVQEQVKEVMTEDDYRAYEQKLDEELRTKVDTSKATYMYIPYEVIEEVMDINEAAGGVLAYKLRSKLDVTFENINYDEYQRYLMNRDSAYKRLSNFFKATELATVSMVDFRQKDNPERSIDVKASRKRWSEVVAEDAKNTHFLKEGVNYRLFTWLINVRYGDVADATSAKETMKRLEDGMFIYLGTTTGKQAMLGYVVKSKMDAGGFMVAIREVDHRLLDILEEPQYTEEEFNKLAEETIKNCKK